MRRSRSSVATATGEQPNERAGFPAASKCMVCHREVAKDTNAIQRLAALDKDTAIVPVKPLYTLPDFVFFSHARHKEKVVCDTFTAMSGQATWSSCSSI